MKCGLFFCRCGPNIGKMINLDDVTKPSLWPSATIVDIHPALCSEEGRNWLRDHIRQNGLERVVVAACSPKEHEATFRKVLSESGLNPFMLQVANIREQCEWISSSSEEATRKAFNLINGALHRVRHHEEISQQEFECSPDVVVIGAGVAGISAALTLSQKKRKIYVVEKDFVLGGTVNILDKILPGFECASCFLEPYLDKLLHDENIEVLTGTELVSVKGSLGNFRARVRRKPRYVDETACLGCSTCGSVCPAEGADMYSGMPSQKRKAVYIPYEGCLPHASVVDAESCLHFKDDSCSACVEACPFGAISLDAAEEEIDLACGSIVVATGAEIPPDFPGSTLKCVVNVFQYERMLHPNGPTRGKILGRTNKAPNSILFGLDGGALREKQGAVSEILKLATLTLEKYPKTSIRVILPFEPEEMNPELVGELLKKNVRFKKGTVSDVKDCPEDGKLSVEVKGKTTTRHSADMVVIYSRSALARASRNISDILGLRHNENGFMEEGSVKFESSSTVTAGVYVAGTVCGYRNIDSSIKDGASAAARILSRLVPGEKLPIDPYVSGIDEEKCSRCGICLGLCPFNAIEKESESGIFRVLETFCRGCGTCAAACPSEAIRAAHFTSRQIFAEIEGVLNNG